MAMSPSTAIAPMASRRALTSIWILAFSSSIKARCSHWSSRITRFGIIASVTHGLSNGLTESVNTKLRLLTRIAYGFRSTDNLIALCLLDRGGHCPALPGRK